MIDAFQVRHMFFLPCQPRQRLNQNRSNNICNYFNLIQKYLIVAHSPFFSGGFMMPSVLASSSFQTYITESTKKIFRHKNYRTAKIIIIDLEISQHKTLQLNVSHPCVTLFTCWCVESSLPSMFLQGK